MPSDMRASVPPEQRSQTDIDATAEQINDLFDSEELARALNTDEFKHFLDHIPIAIVVSKLFRGDPRICYANKAFAALIGAEASTFVGNNWAILRGFTAEDSDVRTLDGALQQGREEFLGTFQQQNPKRLVEAYSGLIENEDGTENYRIAALIDVTGRARRERDEFIRALRDKDTLLKEVQHRVKNNLQLVVALIRLEARSEQRGGSINLSKLAGRIESLQILYQALSADQPGNEVDLGYYLSQIASAVMNAYAVDGVRLDLKVDHAPVSINVGLSIGLVVNEVLTNSFKHAFVGRGSGLITVQCLRKEGTHHQIIVADNGVGLPPNAVWPVPGKIGALIVQTLRENTNADFQVESTPGKGLRVTIDFDHVAPSRRTN